MDLILYPKKWNPEISTVNLHILAWFAQFTLLLIKESYLLKMLLCDPRCHMCHHTKQEPSFADRLAVTTDQ